MDRAISYIGRKPAAALARAAFASVAFAAAALAASAAQAASVLTFHNDNARTGWNANETKLTTANVNPSQFGLKFSVPLDGTVFAQPLFVPNVSIGGTTHNVVIAATEAASVYAVDADSGSVLWKRAFANPPAVVALTACQCVASCSKPHAQGLTGTPTIDIARDSIYVVARTNDLTAGKYVGHYRLHALLIESGNDRVAPTDIHLQAAAPGGATVRLSAVCNLQRAGLAEANGAVYVAFGSQGDQAAATTTGWLAAFNAATLAPIGSFPHGATTAGGLPQNLHLVGGGVGPVRLAGVWMSGSAPVIDSGGNVYVQTGNGAFDGSLDWGMSLLKLTPALSGVLDFFTPSTYAQDNASNRDLGSAGCMLLPQASGSYNVIVGGGKRGVTYLLDTANLGKLQPAGDPNTLFHSVTNTGLWGGPASYIGADGNSYVFVPGGGPMTAWQVQPSPKPNLVQVGQTSDSFGGPDDGGSFPIVSSNGTAAGTAIVWVYSRAASPAELTLRAYDASNLSHELIALPFDYWAGGASTFISPTVVDGKVFAGGYGVLNAYGLL